MDLERFNLPLEWTVSWCLAAVRKQHNALGQWHSSSDVLQ